MKKEQMIVVPESQFRQLLEEAAHNGARRAFSELGLDDEHAAADIRDLRDLMSAYRSVTSEALRTATRLITTAIIGALALGAIFKAGLFKVLG